jgi:hypothetical protein
MPGPFADLLKTRAKHLADKVFHPFDSVVVNAAADVAMSPMRQEGPMLISPQAQGAASLGRVENWEAGKPCG